jgi:hypothetical protein
MTIHHLTMLVLCPALMLAGVAKSQDAQQTVASGTVADAQKKPVGGAEVLAIDSARVVRATTQTAPDGTFILKGLAAHTPYQFTIRKLGFAVGTVQLTTLQANDTLWFDVLLQKAVQTLNPVQVTSQANPGYRIGAAEIAKHSVIDALDVVVRLRPRMLGDAYKECRPDTSHLGDPIPPAPVFDSRRRGSNFSSLHDTRVLFDTSLAMRGYGSMPLPRLSNPSDTLGKSPPSLYINGVLHREWGMKNILSRIPPGDIAEMHYIDCWDTSVPFPLRNALFINLKPGKSY